MVKPGKINQQIVIKYSQREWLPAESGIPINNKLKNKFSFYRDLKDQLELKPEKNV